MTSEGWRDSAMRAKTTAMITVVIVIHLMLALALIGVILVQKSEGGALGMGGGGGMSGFMTGRSAANLLTRTTAILAACFFATSIALAVLAAAQRGQHNSLIDQVPLPTQQSAPTPTAPTPASPATAPKPAAPATPSAPLAK